MRSIVRHRQKRLFSSSAIAHYPRSLPSSQRYTHSSNEPTTPASTSVLPNHVLSKIVASPNNTNCITTRAIGIEDTPDSPVDSTHLPPTPLLAEVRSMIRTSLHPNTQSKTLSDRAKEPTLALYCPIEGGSYVIDETIAHLASLEGADVVTLDGLQLASGTYGIFESAAAPFQQSAEDFYYSSFDSITSEGDRQSSSDPMDASAGPVIKIIAPSSFPFFSPRSRPPPSQQPPSRKSPSSQFSPQKDLFFKQLLEYPRLSKSKRIIYIKDFQYVSDSAPSWLPSLVKEVQERRFCGTGDSKDIRPTMIIFGVTPKVVQAGSHSARSPNSASSSSSRDSSPFASLMSPPPSFMSSLRPNSPSPRSRSSGSSSGQSKPNTTSEEYNVEAREQRLLARLESLEENGEDAILDELPEFEYTLTTPSKQKPTPSESAAIDHFDSSSPPTERSGEMEGMNGLQPSDTIHRPGFSMRRFGDSWAVVSEPSSSPDKSESPAKENKAFTMGDLIDMSNQLEGGAGNDLAGQRELIAQKFMEAMKSGGLGDAAVGVNMVDLRGLKSEARRKAVIEQIIGDGHEDAESLSKPDGSTTPLSEIPSPPASDIKPATFRRVPSTIVTPTTTTTITEPYARVSTILPRVRSLTLESLRRCHTRREVNRVLLRMVLAESGGRIVPGTGVLEGLHLRGVDERVGWGVTSTKDTFNPTRAGVLKTLSSPPLSIEDNLHGSTVSAIEANEREDPVEKRHRFDEEEFNLMKDSARLPQSMWKDFSETILDPATILRRISERALSDVDGLMSIEDTSSRDNSNDDVNEETKKRPSTSVSKSSRLTSTTDKRKKPKKVVTSQGKESSSSVVQEVSWGVLSQYYKAVQDGDSSLRSLIKDLSASSSTSSTSSSSLSPESHSTSIINRIKNDPSLDSYERRLLGCIVDPSAMPTSFKEVHLPERTIDAIRTIVSLPILFPGVFEEGILKRHSMTGALLLGPPGVGKTLLARAVAKESGARMLMVKASDVEDMYVGEGEKLVKSVFSLARRLSPCVVFLDEVDALFASRESRGSGGAASAHRGVITEFMQEMDGLKTNRKDGNVVVIGATNRPFDLDDAVLRRLPRRLLVDLPSEKDRLEILRILLRDEVLAEGVDLNSLAKRAETFSGSDLKHLCVSAALDSAKETLDLPWKAIKTISAEPASVTSGSASPTTVEPPPSPSPPLKRTLSLRHFDKALSEITPSSSESLGTLSDLRKWNEEFGEGYKDKVSKSKRRRWGDKFGFGGKEKAGENDGRVVPAGTLAVTSVP